MADRLGGQRRRHRLLLILSASIPFRDRGLVAQEVDKPREILLLSERKRGRLVILFTVQVHGARRGCYRNLVPCMDMYFFWVRYYFSHHSILLVAKNGGGRTPTACRRF